MSNQKRLLAILTVLWIVAVGTGVLLYVFFGVQTAEYTQECDALTMGDVTFVSDNSSGNGILYAIGGNGKVNHVFNCKGEHYVNGWRIAALAAKDEDDAQRGDFYVLFYRVRSMDNQTLFRGGRLSERAKLTELTPSYIAGGGYEMSGFSISEETCAVTSIHGNGKEISVFEIPENAFVNLTDADKRAKAVLSEAPAEPALLHEQHVEGQGSYAEAEYVQGGLHVRMAGEEPGDHFAENRAAKELFDNKSMGFAARLSVAALSPVLLGAVAASGFAVIAGLIFLLPKRKRVVYRIALTESVLFAAVVFLVFGATSFLAREDRQRGLDAQAYLLSSARIYGDWSEGAYAETLQAVSEQSGKNAEVIDICLVDISSGEIIADLMAHQRYSVDYVYGRAAAEALSGDEEQQLPGAAGGMVRYAVCGDTAYSGSRLLAVVEIPGYFRFLREDSSRILLGGILLFAVLSALEILLALAENRDIAALSGALAGLAGEDFVYSKPAHVTGKDIRRMWSSIHEIEKYLGRESRIRFLTYQAYFRFAPKGIERILNKGSIMEVKSGDATRLVGTLAFVSTEAQRGDDRRQLNRRNEFLRLVDKHREAYKGIYVQGEADLSTMKVLFLEESHRCVRFGIELLSEMNAQEKELRMPQPSVLLHFTPLVYGVAGSDTQASAFLSSPEAEQLLVYADWMRQMGLGVVLTDSVRRRENGIENLRHIGFVRIVGRESEKRIELYEALDAEEFSVRQGKLKHLADFDEALSMFYARDFYFARSAFTEILRDVPQDALVKWYLFECERLLNENADVSFAGELHL